MKTPKQSISKELMDAAYRHYKNRYQDELTYCKKMVQSGHKSPHWAIRVAEITAELNKPTKGKKNVKTTKTRKR